MNFEEYYEKVYGGWLGRVAGSHLGAPLEFRPYARIQRKYCNHGNTDISSYVRRVYPRIGNDDEMYQIVGLIALEEKGINLTSRDIAEYWKKLLYLFQFTAERVALKNIRKGIYPPDSASEEFGNFWFDAIGGQMKADIWGLMTPNCPDLTARYTRIDGEVAHQGLGIEGEIYIATLISNAFGISDIPTLLVKSLEVLPKNSLYRKFVEKCIKIPETNPIWREGRKAMFGYWESIRQQLAAEAKSKKRRIKFFTRNPHLHVLPNAGIIVLSLLYGAADNLDPFGRPMCIAAMMGLDTDCNCGNIGTIMGTMLGAKEIPAKWKDPLKNQFHTFVRNHKHWKIPDLADRIAQMGVKILAANSPEKAFDLNQ